MSAFELVRTGYMANSEIQQTDDSGPPSSKRLLIEGTVVWSVVVVALLFAARSLALGWDEGMTFERVDALEPWVQGIITGNAKQRQRLIQPDVISQCWRFSREEPDGHGPFYGLLSLASHSLSKRWLPPPLSYRLGSIVLFSFAVAMVYTTLRNCWVLGPCLLATCLLATMPRLLPEVCYALVDGPLVSLSLLAWCAFLRGVEGRSWKAKIAFGGAIGSAMATKLTGWFFIFPYLAWTIWSRWLFLPNRVDEYETDEEYDARRARSYRSAIWTLAIGIVVALFVVFAWNVGWWHDPVTGIRNYFVSNLTRSETIPISIQFLGTRYKFSLPWYNTMVWMVVAVPVGTLSLGVIGLARVVYRWRSAALGILLALNWGLLMVIRALPQAPGHDGTRQIAMSLAFLALLAGYGFEGLWRLAGRGRVKWLKCTLAAMVGIAAVGESAWSTGRYHPYQLSYYSPLIGGLPGAAQLGFEPTYFWDTLTPEVLRWLEENTGPEEWVLFRNNTPSFDYLHKWGKMRFGYRLDQEAWPPKWVVYQHRPGMFLPADDWLMEHGQPSYRKQIMGVPVLSIYPYAKFAEAQRVGNGATAPQEPKGGQP